MSSKAARQYSIVLWGATGFAGRLVAQYLAKSAPENMKWAIGGRSMEKLARIKSELCKINPACSGVEILIGDVNDQASVDNVVKQTRVVINTAGPFSIYGTPVVDACARLGTDYCDLTGESPWIKKIIAKYDDLAKKNDAIIIPSCGFDSVPSDMGVLFISDYVRQRYNSDIKEIKTDAQIKGTFSGGTLASAMEMVKQGEISKKQDPYALNPAGDRPPPPPKSMGIWYDKDFNEWRYPFPLGPGNELIVRRSQALSNFRNGHYTYNEMAGTRSLLLAVITSFAMFFMFGILIRFSPLRAILTRMFPPGSGPSEEAMKNGFYRMKLLAITPQKKIVRATVSGKGDPGYSSTSKMIAEAGLCLALQRDQLVGRAGLTTPAVGLGTAFIDRLQNANIMKFSIED